MATFTSFCYAGNYTWNGNTSTAWATSSNWTPSGVPGSTDTVTIVTGSRNVYLAANTSVKQLTITSGTIDLQSYTLSVSATGMFTSGQINNGTLSLYGTSTITFKGTTFGAIVSATGNSILLNGSTFNDSLSVVKKGTAGDNGKGGNTFNGAVSIIDSASGNLVLSDSFPDVFNSRAWVTNRSTGKIYIAHRGTSNQFNGNVTFAGKNIWSNYYGTASYNGNINFDTPNGEVYFGYSNGSCSLSSGKNLSIGTNGFSAGFLYLRNFVQSDSTISINLTLSGTAKIAFESGTSIKANVSASAPFIYLEGTRFLGTCSITTTGSSNITSLGGSYFAKATTMYHNPSAACTFTSGSTSVDTFASPVVLKNGIGTMSINNSLFLDSVTFKNLNTSTGSDRYYIANTGNARMKGKVVLDNALAGMNFGNSGGTTTLDSSASMSVLSTFTGNLTLKNFIQKGSNSVSIALNNSSTKLILNSGTSFEGSFTYYGRNIQLNGTTFNSTTEITRYGTSGDVSSGGNIFNGNTTIRDSSSHNHDFILANSNIDIFNNTITFIQKGTNVNILPAYNSNTIFSGDINFISTSPIQCGANGGKVIFNGNYVQYLTKNSVAPTFRKIEINKHRSFVKLGFPVSLNDSLILAEGILITDTTNILALGVNGIILGGNDSSYIFGPMQKLGNSKFEFPLGDSLLSTGPYHPLSISPPSSITDEFQVQYFPDSLNISGTLDSVDLGICEYWNVKRIAGNSTIKVSLGWNSNSCQIDDQQYMVVSGFDSLWHNYAKFVSNHTTEVSGIIQSLNEASITDHMYFTISKYSTHPISYTSVNRVASDHPRGLYVDKFITLYSDQNNILQLDRNKSILGVDLSPFGSPDGVYEKEIELLNYVKENRFTYLILYGMGSLFNGTLQTNNPTLYNFLTNRLCEFMQLAKNNYCVNSFGTAGFKEDFYLSVIDYNTNNISMPIFNLTSNERSLVNNDSTLIRIIEETNIDSLQNQSLYINQFYRYLLGLGRLVATNGTCINFDVLNVEYEYWNKTDDGDGLSDIESKWNQLAVQSKTQTSGGSPIPPYLFSLRSIADNNNLLTEIYLGYLRNVDPDLYPARLAPQNVADTLDGLDGTPGLRKLTDRILLHFYRTNPSGMVSGSYGDRLNNFKAIPTLDQTDIHPIFSSEEKVHMGAGEAFFGEWFESPILTGENITPNIYSAEKIFYNEWRASSNTTNDENLVLPYAAQWFTSSYMVNQLDHPVTFYTNDAPRCTTTTITSVRVQFNYQGTSEGNITAAFELRDKTNSLEMPSVTCATNVTDDYSVSYPINLCLPSYDLSTSSAKNPYKAVLTLTEHRIDCDYTYNCSRDVWVSNITPQIEVVGNYSYDAGTNTYSICEGEPLLLNGNISGTLQWYKVGTTGSLSTGRSFAPTTTGEYYYYKSNGSCVGNSASVNIQIQANPLASITSSCTANNSNVVFLASSGTSYLWNDGSTNQSLVVTSSGSSSVIITNGSGCTRFASINTLSRPSISAGSPISCNITLSETTFEGSSNYYYEWFKFNPNTAIWQSIQAPTTSNLCVVNSGGQYKVTVSTLSGNNCRTSNPFTTSSNTTGITTASVSQPTCGGGANGSINITVLGSGNTFMWQPGSISTEDLTGLVAGTYTVTVTKSGCSSTQSFVLINSNYSVPSITQTNVSCNGGNNGQLQVTGTCSGCSYQWSSTPPQATNPAIDLSSGIYTVTVTNGSCNGTRTASISEPTQLLTYVSSYTNISCNGMTDGSSVVTAYGGTVPYTYLWSPGNSTIANPSNLSGGTYTVTTTDSKGCSSIAAIIISEPDQLNGSTSSTPASTPSSNDGTASVSISGGTSPYTVSWNTIPVQTSLTATSLVSGVYTATITDANGCTRTSSVSVSFLSCPLSLSTTITNEGCIGQSNGILTFVPTGNTGTVNFILNPGSISNSTGVFSNLPVGVTYNVTATDAINCAATASQHITGNGLPTVISSFSNTASCSEGQINLSASGASSYSWLPSLTCTSPCSTAVVSPSSSTTYTVIGTDVNGCSSSSTITVAQDPLCCHTFASYSNQSDFDDHSPASNTISGSSNLNESVEIGNSSGSPAYTITLSACTLDISGGMTITVHPNSTLHITSSSLLEPCDEMWGGVIVEDGGILIVDGGSEINGAEFGAKLLDGSNFSSDDATFSSNYIGLYVPPASSSLNNVNLLMNKTHFIGTATLPLPYATQSTQPGTYPLAGIFVNDLALLDLQGTVGGTLADQIYFNNLNFGILAHNSNVNLENEIRFENITNYDNGYRSLISDRSALGSSIYSESSTGAELLVVLNNPLFYGNGNGISAFHVNAHLEGNNFGNISTKNGIRIVNSTNLIVEVLNNTILAHSIGIDLNLNDQAQKLNVYGNIINMVSTSGQSIGISAMDGGLSSNYSVLSHNTIYMATSSIYSIGVLLNSCNAYKVASNDIYFPSSLSPEGDGIQVSGCSNLMLTCNYIQGTFNSLSNSSQYGIRTTFSQAGDYFYKCNTVGHTYEGFYFEGTNNGIWESNSMFRDAFGLHVSRSGEMGDQIHEGNSWRGSYTIWAAKHENIPALSHEQIVADPSTLLHMPTSIDPSSGWFNGISGTEASCSSSDIDFPEYCMDPEIVPVSNSRISRKDILTARDSVHSLNFDEQTVWFSKKNLMQKILIDTTLTAEDTSISSFYGNNKLELMSRLGYLNLMKDSLTLLDSASTAISTMDLDSLVHLIDFASYCDSLILNDTTLESETIYGLLGQKDSVLELLMGQVIDNRESLVSIQATLISRGSDLLDGNDTLASGDDFIQNEIDINHFYLSRVSKNDWSSLYPDSMDILAIAVKCPLSSGPSVFGARSLFHFINNEEYYNDDLKCISLDTCSVLKRPNLISAELNFGVCNGSYEYSISSISGATLGYKWSLPPGASFVGDSTGNSITVTFPDTFQQGEICVHGRNACGEGLDRCMAIFGVPKPVDNISGNSSVCASDIEVYTWDASPGAAEYIVIVPDGATCLTGSPTNSTLAVIEYGTEGGEVSIIASSACGNSDTTSLVIDMSCRTGHSSLFNTTQDHLPSIYPNPTNGKTTLIYHLSNSKGYLQLINLFGETLQLIELNGKETMTTFDISDLAPEVIGYRLIDGENIVNNGKIVIIK
ncbi:MAG: SprB repeat-containing protein [Bacteroidetes bacterium]|nr:SprB repeat-containing protein [Bacteroidota bacterium]